MDHKELSRMFDDDDVNDEHVIQDDAIPPEEGTVIRVTGTHGQVGANIALSDTFPFDRVITVTIETAPFIASENRVVGRMIAINEGESGDPQYHITFTDEGDTRIISEGTVISNYDTATITNPWFLVYLALDANFSASRVERRDGDDE